MMKFLEKSLNCLETAFNVWKSLSGSHVGFLSALSDALSADSLADYLADTLAASSAAS